MRPSGVSQVAARWPSFRLRAFAAATVLLVAAASASGAQLITPKTVPVRQAQQFEIFPSDRAGMAGVSIALDDTVLDPFANPAKTVRVPGGLVQISPFVHSVSLAGGGGRTIPVSAFASSGGWSGAALVSLQELDRPTRSTGAPLSEQHGTNEYLAGTLALRLSPGFSVGLGVHWADLSAVDGVDKLYSGSDSLREAGHQLDLRLGLLRQWGVGRSFELLVLRNTYDMRHDVHYPALYRYTPCCPGPPPEIFPEHEEHNADRTNTWGVHTAYSQPVGAHGWRVGWLATMNKLTHPRIPNYTLVSLPRDPGFTNAFNAGAGIARLSGGTTLGIDVVLEPMWSHTWATAAHDTMTAVDGIIHAGARTVDNHFRFANTHLRVGFGQDIPITADSATTLGLQAGLGLYSIKYRLNQQNYVSYVSRTQDENWIEWTPTLGARLRSRNVEVAYTFSMTCGPDCSRNHEPVFYPPPVPLEGDGGGVIAAPNAPLTFDGGRATMHRITVSFRMR